MNKNALTCQAILSRKKEAWGARKREIAKEGLSPLYRMDSHLGSVTQLTGDE